MYSSRLLIVALIGVALAVAAPSCQPSKLIGIGVPFENQLSLVGDLNVRVLLPRAGDPATLLVELDDGGGPIDVTALLSPGTNGSGLLSLAYDLFYGASTKYE